jgi:hypothetical protein
MLGGWCQEVYACQAKINAQLQEVHNFIVQLVPNIRTQAAYITSVLTAQKEDGKWKQEAETSIRQVQQAGNQLETRVKEMGEAQMLIRMD